MTVKSIYKAADEILQKYGGVTLPIDPEQIARRMGIGVVPYPMENDVSGMLVINASGATIGYNNAEPKKRIRFTIAHEIGHFVLHNNNTSKVFVDNQLKVHFRSNESQQDSEKAQMEFEANTFAAALLMPEAQLLEYIKQLDLDLGDDEGLNALANKFMVSTSAMYYRLVNLRKF